MLPDLKNMSYPELRIWTEALGEPSYRADQLMKWMYLRDLDDPAEMTDIPKKFRHTLRDEARISRLEPAEIQTSVDGARKLLFVLDDGERIESVLIPERDHFTLCVSTQVGCSLGCAFCLTGTSGLKRNLTSGEIVNQVLAARRELSLQDNLTNLVLMGMGEPLANYSQTVRALKNITGSTGLGFSARRVTVSTAGIAPRIVQLGHHVNVSLAVSLNAADNDLRSQLMPVNRTYPLEALMEACRKFPLRHGRRITYEYILIRDVNDGDSHARKLTGLLRPGSVKINLIPFNEHPASSFRSPTMDRVEGFQRILLEHHFTVIVRKSKGRDIMAACGQLAGYRGKELDNKAEAALGRP